MTDKLQQVLNVAAELLTRRPWLDVPERIQFRAAATVHRFLKGLAHVYFYNSMVWRQRTSPNYAYHTAAKNHSRQRLRSYRRNQSVVPSVTLSSYGSRSFAFSGPTVCNKLPDYLRNPSLSIDIFNRDLKTFLFAH